MASVTIVIPTHNRPRMLGRCLASLAGAATSRLEVIVVDDGSLREDARHNERICGQLRGCRYIRFDESRGAPAARNHGMLHSHGDFVWFMDDDDYVSRRTVEDVLAAVAQPHWKQRIILLPMTIVVDGQPRQKKTPDNQSLDFERLRHTGHDVNTSCVVFPRSVLNDVGGWDERLVAGQDTDLFLRISKQAVHGCLQTPGVFVDRGHPLSITRSFFRQQVGKIQFLWKHWWDLSLWLRCRYMYSMLICIPGFGWLRQLVKLGRASHAYASRLKTG